MPVEGSTKAASFSIEAYHQAALHGQIASGILFLVGSVAITLICTLHSPGTYIAANLPSSITLCSVGGLGFIGFVIFSCMRYYTVRKKRLKLKDQQQIARVIQNQGTLETKVAVTATLQANPVDYLKQVLVQPLLRELQGAIQAMVVSDAQTNADVEKIEKVPREVATVFANLESLFIGMLEKPEIYVKELLELFVKAKASKKTIALRRLVSAYNSGDLALLKKESENYNALLKGFDFSKIVQSLSNQEKTAEQLFSEMPSILEEHFCKTDAFLKQKGREILDKLFLMTKNDQKVQKAFVALINQSKTPSVQNNPTKIVKNLEAFVELVQKQANVPIEQYAEWNKALLTYVLDTLFKDTVCNFLGMVARTIRILKLLFKKGDTQNRCIALDETFLLSESGEYIKKIDLQTDMFRVQSAINYSRDSEKRIALIALEGNYSKDYETLAKEIEVVDLCFRSNKHDLKDLEKINASKEVQALQKTHKIRIIALPVTLSDHMFKSPIKYEDWLSGGAPLLKYAPSFILDGILYLIKNKAIENLPEMNETQQKKFGSMIKSLFDLMLDPILDGAIRVKSDFREPFEHAITTKGEALAKELEDLISNKKQLTFEQIRDAWADAMHGLAEEFNKTTQEKLDKIKKDESNSRMQTNPLPQK